MQKSGLTNWFEIKTARQKISALPDVLEALARQTDRSVSSSIERLIVPSRPGRDAEVLEKKFHPGRKGLSFREGHCRLLHDLGNIELQAMELAIRTAYEFPEAPDDFRAELLDVAAEEARHFGLCLDALDELEFPWGSLPVHCSLWDAVETDVDRGDLLSRIMLVHRYMEGSGLDAGVRTIEQLSGVRSQYARLSREVVSTIVREEVGHVSFGSRWFRKICESNGLDPEAHFAKVYPEVFWRMPRTEKPAIELRRQGGFSDGELEVMELTLRATDFSRKRPEKRPTC